ncbi:alpha/beta hydrolase [Parvularcula sp. ZS-1/3]|uniref:Alpha/beta hydrolase n=1 Tax=Parvularcula mediterranea TaxID=2732508 RepID=A0A7Y3W6G1_9PROT|nr:alpha/beta hydrolase [Parvularcula mediterranea]NNU17694.1 alpha/beta hydrolase [Parvularcula mediterranea]
MLRRLRVAFLVAAVLLGSAEAQIIRPKPLLEETSRQPAPFETPDGQTLTIDQVTLRVPAIRAKRNSDLLAVRFLRFPAVAPEGYPPLLYLADGPASELAVRDWSLLGALRQTRDVILIDPRGTGLSDQPPACESSYGFASGAETRRDAMVATYRRAFRQCRSYWEAAGVDLKAYSPVEAADDLAAIANILGGRVAVLASGRGTHLALAMQKRHPKKVNRLVLSSTEGLGQTLRYPQQTDKAVERIDSFLGERGARGSSLSERLVRLIEELDASPQRIVLAGEGRDLALSGFLLQIVAAQMVADPAEAGRLEAAIASAEDGDFQPLASLASPHAPARITLEAPMLGSRLASGADTVRRARLRVQARSAVLGEGLNFPIQHLAEDARHLELRGRYRDRPGGRTPTLVLMGELDGWSYPEEARKATRSLRKNRTLLLVEGAGSDLLSSSPDAEAAALAFLSGDEPESGTIAAAPLTFEASRRD